MFKRRKKISIFSLKKPSFEEQVKIESLISSIQSWYKCMFTSDNIEYIVNSTTYIENEFSILLKYEKKYPSHFVNKPSDAYEKMKSERNDMERQFVERYVYSIEKKLLEYKTDRGKKNNLKKLVDKFVFYADNFSPESFDYFKDLIYEKFTKYLF